MVSKEKQVLQCQKLFFVQQKINLSIQTIYFRLTESSSSSRSFEITTVEFRAKSPKANVEANISALCALWVHKMVGC